MNNPLTTTSTDPTTVRALLQEAHDRSRSWLDREIMKLLLDYGPERAGMYALTAETGGVIQAFPLNNARQDAWFLARGAALLAARSAAGRQVGVFVAQPGYAGGQHACLPEFSWPPKINGFARALSPSAAVIYPDSSERRMVAEAGMYRLAELLDLAERLRRWCPTITAGLRAMPAFHHAQNAHIFDFLASGEPATLEPGTRIATTGEVPDRAFLVLSGSVDSIVLPAGSNGSLPGGGTGIHQVNGPGELVAFPPMAARAPSLSQDTVRDRCTGLWLPLANLIGYFEAHPQAARAMEEPLEHTFLPCAALVAEEAGVPPELAGAVTRLAAAYLAHEFGDLVLLLHLIDGEGPPVREEGMVSEGVYRATVPVGAGSDLHAQRRELARIFRNLQSEKRRPMGLVLIETADSRALLAAGGFLAQRVFRLTPTPIDAPPFGFENSRSHTVALLAPVGRPGHQWPAGATRVRWDDAEVIRRGQDATWVTREGADAESGPRGIRRVGRALSERLVGIALGGGGVPGFAHVALLRGLRNEAPALPIDIVAGTSIGSLVGAWYVGRLANPRPGEATLESLLNQGRLLNLLMPAAMVDSHLLERWLNRAFPVHDQTQFEVPFTGVSTDVLSATVWTCAHGSLGSAARKSSAFAPMFPPVLVPGARLLDGGFADNVPVAVVRALGGAFVIGSNAVGVSNASPSTESGASGWRSVLAALNPIARMESALHGGFVIFHRLGDFESRMANVAYEAAYSGDRFWDFSRGREVVAQTQEAATAFAMHTAAMWRAWARPRRSAG